MLPAIFSRRFLLAACHEVHYAADATDALYRLPLPTIHLIIAAAIFADAAMLPRRFSPLSLPILICFSLRLFCHAACFFFHAVYFRVRSAISPSPMPLR